ncbi:hypothetical protein FRC06_003152 [Ceratobasidium sp. 370]|nr:hypothetical protein FRC06_003152 [Ceratobasidium sp. 370]
MAASGVPIPGAPTSRSRFKDKLSSNFDDFARKIKPRFPDFAVFAATMTGLPIVRDAVNSVQVMQDWTSCRQKLADFQQKLERLLNAIESHSQDPGYMNVTMVEFKGNLENMLAQVRRESARQSSSHFDSTTRLLALIDEYEEQATVLVEEALVSGIFAQQNIVLPEEYDKIIPTLKSLHRGNGLVQKALVKVERYDGGPVEHAPVQNLHVTTHQGTYNDAPVEIKEYFGGPENQLLESEDVWNITNLPENAPWPIKQLCELLQEANKQGIPWDAISALRAHSGPWDKIAVWKIAKQIDLRPPEANNDWYDYPPRDWQVHAGMIVDLAYDEESFEQLDMMPRQGLSRYERAHLRKLNVTFASGYTVDQKPIRYIKQDGPGRLQQMPDKEWECLPLEPWKGLDRIMLIYESERITHVPWEQWKIILASCAKRRGRDINDLAVITRIEAILNIRKDNVPELGTRPIYFFRKPNQATATPREFWGFFSFNPDPNGPPGISVRVNPQGNGCLVSDWVVEPDPKSWASHNYEMHLGVVWVSMRDDWENKIQEELDRSRRNPCAIFMEEDITWSGDEGEITSGVDWN